MFIPGSAGNFFSRCLSLASDRCYGLVPAKTKTIDFSIQEKFNFYQYPNMPESRNWLDFEKQLVPYYRIHDHRTMPDNSCSIWLQHPSYALIDRNLGGTEITQLRFYIDPSRRFEWTVLNALYKNSYIDSRWLEEGERMLNDPTFTKIDINHIVDSSDTLLAAVSMVCEISGIEFGDFSREKIQQLWYQWKKTTLPESEFMSYKRRIGFRM
jgi:hypothetical protein